MSQRVSHLSGVTSSRALLRPLTTIVVLLLALAVPAGAATAQETAEPVDSPELIEVRGQLAAIACPTVPGLVDEPIEQQVAFRNDDGIASPGETLTFACRYRAQADPASQPVDVTVTFRWIGTVNDLSCNPEPPVREEQNGRLTARELRPVEAVNARLSYQIPNEVVALAPGVDTAIESSFVAVVQQLSPLATTCQMEPIALVCPPIAGTEVGEPEEVDRTSLIEGICRYRPDDGGSAIAQVVWATDQSGEAALRQACSDPGEPFRERTGIIAHGSLAAQARWLTSLVEAVPPEAVQAAAAAMLDQVVPQAAACEGVPVEPLFEPVPAYLADVFRPDRIDGLAFADDEQARAAVAAVGGPSADATATPPPTTIAATTPASPTTEPTPAATVVDAPAAADDVRTPDAIVAATAPSDERPGWQTTVLRIVSIGALVLSLLGVALTLFLMRRESRVRPKLDVARVLIVLAVAIVSILVFSRGAPIWAIVVAVALGGALGLAQGRHLTIRAVGKKLYAQRVTWGVIAFAAALIVTQIAGWLNRSGVIALGIALSFLSAALTTGVIVGRRPQLDAARLGATPIVIVVAALTVALAVGPGDTGFGQDDEQPAPEQSTDGEEIECTRIVEPGIRCAAHERLIDLVDWDNVSFNGGLLIAADKPPIIIAVPRGLSDVPEPVTRTIDWTTGDTDENRHSVTETFTFDLDEDGLCCSIGYEGTASETFASGVVNDWVASGQLSDIKTIGEGSTGPFESISNVVQGVPFGEANLQTWGNGGEEVCERYVAETVPTSNRNEAFSVFTRNGESQLDQSSMVSGLGASRMSIPCEVPGYSIEEALAAAPPPPVGNDRPRPCPTRQEWVRALGTDGYPITANSTIGEMFVRPNDPLCSDGSLSSPTVFGDARRGATRSEFNFELGPPDRQTAWGDDWALFEAQGVSSVPMHHRCPVGEDGRPSINPNRATCAHRTAHRLDGGGWFTIDYDQQTFDGPNVTIRASLPWGAYYYRCHHCELNDPEVERFLGTLHDFARGWPEALAAEGYGVTEQGEIVDTTAEATDASATTVSPTPVTDELADQAEQLGIDPELAELFIDEDDTSDEAGAAALAALVGLLGATGLAGTALAESGMSATELAETFRRGGLDALDDELDARARADAEQVVIDEHGNQLRPAEDGLYEWDDGDSIRRVGRDELEDLIGREVEADAARQQRIDSITDWHASEERARIALEQLNARSQTADDLAAERLRDELRRAERADLTRQRVADHLAEQAADGGWDAIAERLERGDSLSRDELLELRTVLDRLTRQQGAIDPETTGTYLDDLADEFAQDAAVAQEALARVAEVQGGPLAGWAVRNPVAAGRIGAAVATGGFSEGLLTPLDVMNAMERAAEQAHAQGRDLTYEEALVAGAWEVGPGMLFGHLAEAGLTRYGGQMADAAQESFDSAARSIDDWLEAGARAGDDVADSVAREAADSGSRWVGGSGRARDLRNSALADEHGLHWVGSNQIDAVDIRNAPGGTIVPQSRIASDYGIRPESYRQLRQAVERTGAGVEVRSASGRVPEILERGGVPKPESVKVKTANEFDRYMGLGDDVDATVPWRPEGWPEPKPDVVPDNYLRGAPDDVRLDRWRQEGYPGTKDRWEWRQQEIIDNQSKMNDLIERGEARVNTDTNQLEMRNDRGGWGPVTGDHDIFRFQIEIPPGLSPDEAAAHMARQKAEILAELKLPPFSAQHGAHIDWVPVTESGKRIDSKIMGGHTAGRGDGLLAVYPGRPAHVTYSTGTR